MARTARPSPDVRDEIEVADGDLVPEQVAQAPEPIGRLDVARGGSGVGLAIAARYARTHNGRGWLEPASSDGLVAKVTALLA